MSPETRASFNDGQSAIRHKVTLTLSEDKTALILTAETLDDPIVWRFGDLRALPDRAADNRLVLTRLVTDEADSAHDAARLTLTDHVFIGWLHNAHPHLWKRDLKKGTWRKIGLYSGGAIVATLLMLFVILPAMAGTLARIIPIEREIAFGKTVTQQMQRFLGGRGTDLTCNDPAGRAALDKMLARLTDPQDMAYDVELQVFDHPMVNAFAAPGGQVVILRGLLATADGPDEVAGVLAHEIAHVEHRDATRNALRSAGSAGLLSMVLGDFSGGALLAIMGEQVLSASYTREAEAAADDFALNMLDGAQVSAEGLNRFFEKLGRLEGGIEIPEYLSSHPHTGSRATKADDFAHSQTGTSAILSDEEWQALRRICR